MKNYNKIILALLICVSFLTIFDYTNQNLIYNNKSNVGVEDFQNNINEVKTSIDKVQNTLYNTSVLWDEVSNDTSAISKNSKIVVDSKDNIHIVWEDNRDGDADILYRMFNFTTSEFTSIYNVSDYGVHIGNESITPDMAIDSSDNLYVTWVEKVGSNRDVYCRCYNSTSQTWNSTIFQVATNPGDDEFPSISVNSTKGIAIAYSSFDNINAWEDLKISYFNGISWSEHLIYTGSISPNDYYHPDIQYYNDDLHLTALDQGASNYDIIYARATGFSNFPAETTIRSTSAIARRPELSINNRIYLTWQEISGSYHIYSTNKIEYQEIGHLKFGITLIFLHRIF